MTISPLDRTVVLCNPQNPHLSALAKISIRKRSYYSHLSHLAACRFIERKESIIFCGPVGVGKTHLAQALGHQACRLGYSVLFSKASRLLSDLGGGRADGTWEKRLRRYLKPDLRGKIYVYRHEWGAGIGFDNGIPFSELYYFNLGAQHSDDLAFMYDWNDIKGPAWFETWTREFAFNDDNYAGRKALSDAVGAYLKAFLHSEDGVITKNNDMPVEWKPWTADSEQFITWNATKTEAKLGMNSTEVFTEDTLREYLESSIDNLPEATNEDKTALKVWAANALKEAGFSSWYDELQG